MSSNTIDLDDYEKINFLFKNYLGFPNTDKTKPFYLETEVKANNYLFGNEIFLDNIPENPIFNQTISETTLNIPSSKLDSSDSLIQKDSTNVIMKFTKLKLEKIQGTRRGYYCKDSNGENILKDALQFNKNKRNDGTQPYLYKLFTNSNQQILSDRSGGNWIFDVKNGVVNFPDEITGFTVNENNLPYLTFYKYVGRKGISNLSTTDVGGLQSNTNNINLRISELSGNVIDLSSNIYRKDYIDTSFNNISNIANDISNNTYRKDYVNTVITRIDNTVDDLSSNIYRKDYIDTSFNDLNSFTTDLSTNVYRKDHIDTSFNDLNSITTDLSSNVYRKEYIDTSFNDLNSFTTDLSSNVYRKDYIDTSFNDLNSFTTDLSSNVYRKDYIDTSFNDLNSTTTDLSSNVYRKDYIDTTLSVIDNTAEDLSSNVYRKDYIDTSFNDLNSTTTDLSSNVYRKDYIDVSFNDLNSFTTDLSSNVYRKDYIDTSFNNVNSITSDLSSNVYRKDYIDISFNNVNSFTTDLSSNVYRKDYIDTTLSVIDNTVEDLSTNVYRKDYIDVSFNDLNSFTTDLSSNVYRKDYINTTLSLIDNTVEDLSSNVYRKDYIDTTLSVIDNTVEDLSRNVYRKDYIDTSFNNIIELTTDLSDNTIRKNEDASLNTLQINNLYLNSNNGPVIFKDNNTLEFSVDNNDHLKLSTSGSGNLQIQSVGPGDISLVNNGGGNIAINGNSMGDVSIDGRCLNINTKVNINSGVLIQSTGDDVKIDDNLIINRNNIFVSRGVFGGGNIDISGVYKVEGVDIFTTVDSKISAADLSLRGYIDGVISGLDIKDSVKAASTSSINLLSNFTSQQLIIDGINISSNERVLLKDQTDSKENGIYELVNGTLERANDFKTNSNVSYGAFTFVEQGLVNNDKGFVLIKQTQNSNDVDIGTTELSFSQFSGAGQIISGNGILKNGNELSVNIDDDTIDFTNGKIKISDNFKNKVDDLSSNVYRKDYIDTSLNVIDNTVEDLSSNIYRKNYIDTSFNDINSTITDLSSNVYRKDYIDTSFNDINSTITDLSSNIYRKNYIDTSFNDIFNTSSDLSSNVYRKNYIDTSFNEINSTTTDLSSNVYDISINVYRKDHIDTSFNDLNSTITDLSSNVYDLSSNVYRKDHIDTSFNDINSTITDLSSNVYDLSSNVYRKDHIDTSFNDINSITTDLSQNVYRKDYIDTSFNEINSTTTELSQNVYRKDYIDTSFNDINSITIDLSSNVYRKSEIDIQLGSKQDTLTAADGTIVISNNTIRANITSINSLEDINDVDYSSNTIENEQILKWDSNSSKWVPQDPVYSKSHVDTSFNTINSTLTDLSSNVYRKEYIDTSFNTISSTISDLSSNIYDVSSNVYRKNYIDASFNGINNTTTDLSSNVYRKDYIDTSFNDINSITTDLSQNVYRKDYIDTSFNDINSITTDLSSNVYRKSEIDIQLGSKQDTLTAADGTIVISNNTIRANITSINSLEDINDVNYSSNTIENEQILKWDSNSSKWVPQDPVYSKSHVDTSFNTITSTLTDLSSNIYRKNYIDTSFNTISSTISDLSSNIYDVSSNVYRKSEIDIQLGSKQDTLTAADGSIIISNNTIRANITSINSLEDINDVNYSSNTIENEQILKWDSNSSKWIPQDPVYSKSEVDTSLNFVNSKVTDLSENVVNFHNIVELGDVNLNVLVSTKTSNHPYYGSNYSGLAYFINDLESPILTLLSGKTYYFNVSNTSNSSHPIKFYYDLNKTREYTDNITRNFPNGIGNTDATIVFEVSDSTPTKLFYQCSINGHNGMGNYLLVNGFSLQTKLDSNNVTINERASDISQNVINLSNNVTNLDLSFNDLSQNVYRKNHIDTSFNNVITTVKQISQNDSTKNVTHSNINTISFDYDAGLNVERDGQSSEVKITLGSHWKDIQIDGQVSITPAGEEALNLITGEGISIVGNSDTSNGSAQSLTFALDANFTDLKDVPSQFTNNSGKFLRVKSDESGIEFTDPPSGGSGGSSSGGSTGGGSGSSITVIPSTTDLSANRSYPNGHTGTGTEGEIIYDASKNKFYEASNSKDDNTGNGVVEFRPLGYSFFSENMEGQSPNVQATSFFFFELTPSSIVLHWINPPQYESGITASTSQTLNETSPIVSQPSGGVGGKINFPVVNRIMIQIKNLQTGNYISWGTKRSPISQYVTGLTGGYVICSKDYPIPPLNTNRNFGNSLSNGGRSLSVYKLEDFADSIILYSAGNTPTNDIIKSGISSYPKRIFPVSGETNKELNTSDAGYEIKFWYENEYKVDPNSTVQNGWGMTENDFNVITLNQAKDQNGDSILNTGKINFLSVQPPTSPFDCSCSIVFNNLGNVSNGSTIVEIKVKDPENTTSTGSQYNSTINLTEIKFEYMNDTSSGTNGGWETINEIFDKNAGSTSNNTSIATKNLQGQKVTLSTSGVYSINRKRDDNYRYFYVEVNNDMLGVTNYAVKKYLSFKVSYKNASIDKFGPSKVSNELIFDKPIKPTISEIKMTSYNTFTITLANFSDTEDIIGNTTSIVNNNMGVFLRNINFNVAYKYSDETTQTDITSFTSINGGESSQSTSTNTPVYINTTSFSSSTYTYILPTGYIDSSNTKSITYFFSARVQNNLISEYSELSDQKTIEITKPDQNSDSINFTILDSTLNKNNTLRVSWNHPSDGERGIVTTQSSTGLPKIQKYTFKSTYLKDYDNDESVDHDETNINSASNRYSDPSTTKEFTFYDALNYDGSNITKTINGGLDIEIKEYNEYVNNSSTFSSTISATATKPGEATNLRNSAINILTSTTKNNTTILWTAPSTSQRGLTIGGVARDNTIIQYDISINRITANKYLLGKNAESTPSFTTTNYTTTITNSDGTSDKISTTEPSTSLSLVKTLGDNDMFLWPDSTYTFKVKTTNSLGYQTTGVNKSFTTPAPSIPSGLNYFNDSRLSTLSTGKTTNLSNHSHYSNKGVLVSSDISTSTSYSGTPVQITKLFTTSKPTDITSNTVHHLLNKTSFQDSTWNNSNATVVSWTDSNPPSSSNQSQFKVFNVAPSSDIEVYTIGTSSDFSSDSGDNKDSVGIKFDITRADRKDGYKYNINYDSRNYGYWYSESVKYTITFTTGSSVREADLYTPLKYELRSYYNISGNGTVSTSANGSTTILQNSTNTNGYIYFDDSCTTTPLISKYNSLDMITYTTNNKINGIPNLHLFNSQTATIALTYTAGGYSKRYLLNKSLNALEHYFSYSTGNKKAIITWNNHTSSAPSISSNKYEREQNQWDVSGLLITSFPSTSTATVEITLKITAKNTFGTASVKTIESGDSSVYNFIYDKPSVDFYNSLGTSLKKAKQITTTDTNAPGNYDALGNTTDENQLNMWNGWFYSKLGWTTSTGISTTNCSNYGLSATDDPMFKGDHNDYKFVIFEYSYQAVSGYTPFGGFVVFGDNADFELSDIAGGLQGGKKDIKLYLFIQDYNMNSHYYLNIGESTSTTFGNAASGDITGYNGSGLGKVPYTSSNDDTNWRSGGSLIPTSGNGGWGDRSSTDYTNRPSSSNLKRTINFIYNKVGNYNSATSGNIFKHYLCIGIKNSINRKVKKPDLYIYAGASTVKKLS